MAELLPVASAAQVRRALAELARPYRLRIALAALVLVAGTATRKLARCPVNNTSSPSSTCNASRTSRGNMTCPFARSTARFIYNEAGLVHASTSAADPDQPGEGVPVPTPGSRLCRASTSTPSRVR